MPGMPAGAGAGGAGAGAGGAAGLERLAQSPQMQELRRVSQLSCAYSIHQLTI